MADKDDYHKEEEEDEDEEDLDESGYKNVKDAVLFAIEVSNSMIEPPREPSKLNSDSPTAAALKCAYAMMQQRIISSPKDMIGILLYGTAKSKFHDESDSSRGVLSYPHCYLLTDLNIPDADDVKALKRLVEDESESTNLLVPSKEPVSMANVLFCANQIFTTRAPNFSSRRLFIVTDNDNPHAADKALRSSAAVRAKDLYDLGIGLELFPIDRRNHEFDRSKFYDDIIYTAEPTDPDAPAYPIMHSKVSAGDGISLLGSLLSSINSKAVARRAQFSNIALEIGPGFKISVKGYILFKRQEPVRSTFVWLHGEKPLITTLKSTLQTDDTARPVEKAEVRKAFKFGGEQVIFTPEEISSLRYFGDPVIRIIGFKPMSMLPIWANSKQSTFLYPSEEDYVGSTRVFSALQQKLLKDKKMAVTWFVARKNAVPVIAALIPGAEKLGDRGEQLIPPGLWLIPLPFADDIRSNPPTTLVRSPDELTDIIQDVIKLLQLPKAQYNPEKYPNPSLQWFYRILQALALDEELPEKPEDKTIPKYKQIAKRAGEYITAWEEKLDAEHRTINKSFYSPLAKRPAPSSGSNDLSSKRVKAEPTNDVLGDEKIAKLAKGENLQTLKVVDLKAWLTKKNMSVNGKKDELIERIEAWAERQ